MFSNFINNLVFFGAAFSTNYGKDIQEYEPHRKAYSKTMKLKGSEEPWGQVQQTSSVAFSIFEYSLIFPVAAWTKYHGAAQLGAGTCCPAGRPSAAVGHARGGGRPVAGLPRRRARPLARAGRRGRPARFSPAQARRPSPRYVLTISHFKRAKPRSVR
jgi:hypothetical protein